MPALKDGLAPDFTLTDTDGNLIHLADLCKKQPVVLVFNRGFA
jgi:peroxiredoxin